MRILLRLFKVSSAQAKDDPSTSASISGREEVIRKDIVAVDRFRRSSRGRKPEWGRKDFRSSIFICRRDVARGCFYSTIHLSRPGRQDQVQTTATMKEDVTTGLATVQKAESVVHGGNNKVLPINSATSTGATKEQFGTPEKEKLKVEKATAKLRMKELLKWAAASKAEKGRKFISRKILNFHNRGALKAVPGDDQLSNDSPKISFRWDLDNCSTASFFYSAASLTSSRIILEANLATSDQADSGDRCCGQPGKGNWITTDAEFVVLEL